MRLIVGCTLDLPEITAIQEGEELRVHIERRLRRWPLKPPDPEALDALELLSWMIAHDHLDVKVAVPADRHGRPVGDPAIFHEKTGIIEDTKGDRIAWAGSLNETRSGWQDNWESFNVFKSWGTERARVEAEEENFELLWSGSVKRAIIRDLPEAVREDLLKFLPKDGLPEPPGKASPLEPGGRETKGLWKLHRRRVWSFVDQAPALLTWR